MVDFRYALRVLWHSPVFATIAILSLALGIGANTAIFSVSWVLFSQPLTVHDPDRLLCGLSSVGRLTDATSPTTVSQPIG